jgi:hypothetical protein
MFFIPKGRFLTTGCTVYHPFSTNRDLTVWDLEGGLARGRKSLEVIDGN